MLSRGDRVTEGHTWRPLVFAFGRACVCLWASKRFGGFYLYKPHAEKNYSHRAKVKSASELTAKCAYDVRWKMGFGEPLKVRNYSQLIFFHLALRKTGGN